MMPLEHELARAGVEARVEVRQRLVLVVPRDPGQVLTAEQRRAIVALAAAQGHTHVALELAD
jgi:hypothetical protein